MVNFSEFQADYLGWKISNDSMERSNKKFRIEKKVKHLARFLKICNIFLCNLLSLDPKIKNIIRTGKRFKYIDPTKYPTSNTTKKTGAFGKQTFPNGNTKSFTIEEADTEVRSYNPHPFKVIKKEEGEKTPSQQKKEPNVLTTSHIRLNEKGKEKTDDALKEYSREAVLKRFKEYLKRDNGHSSLSEIELDNLVQTYAKRADKLKNAISNYKELGTYHYREEIKQALIAKRDISEKVLPELLDLKVFSLALRMEAICDKTLLEDGFWLPSTVKSKTRGLKSAPHKRLFNKFLVDIKVLSASSLETNSTTKRVHLIYLREPAGEGSSNIVYRGYDTITGQKMIERNLKNLSERILWENEMEKHYQLSKEIPGLVQVYGIVKIDHQDAVGNITSKYRSALMEHAGKDLQIPKAVNKNVQPGQNLSTVYTYEEQKNIAKQLARTLADMHKAGYIHCDLKPLNIFIQEDGKLKIGDLGAVRQLGNSSKKFWDGTLLYQDPSALKLKDFSPNEERGYDNWALGKILLELRYGRVIDEEIGSEDKEAALLRLYLQYMTAYKCLLHTRLGEITIDTFFNALENDKKPKDDINLTKDQKFNYLVELQVETPLLKFYTDIINRLKNSSDDYDQMIAALLHPNPNYRLTAEEVLIFLETGKRCWLGR